MPGCDQPVQAYYAVGLGDIALPQYGYRFKPFDEEVLGIPLSKVPEVGVIVTSQRLAKYTAFYDEVKTVPSPVNSNAAAN